MNQTALLSEYMRDNAKRFITLLPDMTPDQRRLCIEGMLLQAYHEGAVAACQEISKHLSVQKVAT